MRDDLIERTRLAAQILRDVGGQSALATTVDEAADALEAAREDAGRYRWIRSTTAPGYMHFPNGEVPDGLALGALDAAIDQARGEVGK